MGLQILSIKSIYTFLAREKHQKKKSEQSVDFKLCESSKTKSIADEIDTELRC